MSQRAKLWGIVEVADHLGVPVKTVRAWRHRQIGPPSFKVGRHVRYRPEDVETWLDAQAEAG